MPVTTVSNNIYYGKTNIIYDNPQFYAVKQVYDGEPVLYGETSFMTVKPVL